MIINAAYRLRATIVEAMSVPRKEAINYFINSSSSDTLFEHYILVHEFLYKQELKHWQKECRTFLNKMLSKTILKSGVLKKSEYLHFLWENHADNTNECLKHANNILIVEGLNDEDRKKATDQMNFKEISADYKSWLSKWYDYYHNPHSTNKNTLPFNLF